MKTSLRLMALTALGLVWGVPHQALAASESRCAALGANCICSEPLNTATYAPVNGAWWNPGDTTTKECLSEGQGAIQNGGGFQYIAAASGADINALPAGHTNTYVLRDDSPNNGGFIGGRAPAGTPTARRAIRFYKFFSSDYNAQEDTAGGCNANKIAQFGRLWYEGPMFTTEGGEWTIYDINTSLGFNQTVDCCVGPGPGNAQNGPSMSGLRGKWWRFEFIVHNAAPSGPGTYFEEYIKNVTDNGPELKVLDTSQTQNMAAGDSWGTNLATNLHVVGGNLDTLLINAFRSSNSAPCTGYASFSHYLMAAWSTDAGQRIGAAAEIEGGVAPAPDTTSPAKPQGLRFQ
jgi:hypothetical protein